MLYVTHLILDKWMPRDDLYKVLRFQCVEALVNCYKQVDVWTQESAPVLAQYGRQFVMLYVELHDMVDDPQRWVLKPKLHHFIHLCEKTTSPRDTWAYWDESCIGEGANLAETVNPQNLATTLIERYRIFEFS